MHHMPCCCCAGVAGTRRIVNLAEVLRECNALTIGTFTFECKSHAFESEVKVRLQGLAGGGDIGMCRPVWKGVEVEGQVGGA